MGENIDRIRTVEITYEGDLAQVALMGSIAQITQAVFDYTQRVELMAQQMSNMPMQSMQAPLAIGQQQTVQPSVPPQQVLLINGRFNNVTT